MNARSDGEGGRVALLPRSGAAASSVDPLREPGPPWCAQVSRQVNSSDGAASRYIAPARLAPSASAPVATRSTAARPGRRRGQAPPRASPLPAPTPTHLDPAHFPAPAAPGEREDMDGGQKRRDNPLPAFPSPPPPRLLQTAAEVHKRARHKEIEVSEKRERRK